MSSMPDSQDLAEKHAGIARRFIVAADYYLFEKDFIQASEKLWGAAAHAMKTFCIRRGWKHGKYSHLRRAMQRMSERTGDNYWTEGFKAAYNLHLNFYNDDMEQVALESRREIVRDLVNLLLAATWDGDG